MMKSINEVKARFEEVGYAGLVGTEVEYEGKKYSLEKQNAFPEIFYTSGEGQLLHFFTNGGNANKLRTVYHINGKQVKEIE